MARRTKEEAQQTRCNIMSTALDLFCQQGLARTSLTDIAKATDLTRGAIYWHFQNKVDLFQAMLERLHLPLEELAQASEREDEPNPLGQTRELLVRLIEGPVSGDALARDAGLLVHLAGYQCTAAGMVNMFPHTAHVESMAVFDRV